jgi:hypothetical protein
MSSTVTTFFQIESLSGVTLARRIEELGNDIECTLKEQIFKFIFSSLALEKVHICQILLN